MYRNQEDPLVADQCICAHSSRQWGWLSAVLMSVLIVLGFGGSVPAIAQTTLRNLDSHIPFSPPADLQQWQKRSDQLRLQLQVAVGLWPYPTLNAVSPAIYGRREMEGYSVEKCIFESLPGLFVTGTLFRPAKVEPGQKVPGILCPHGHWPKGRFMAADDVREQLASGAERFESAASSPLQARCVQLARMGCVVYHYDMLGYADSRQISLLRAHGFATQPQDKEVSPEGWLLYSPLAEAHCQSVMGLQTLASLRAVDMLLSLPEVDSQRIAITGASGGGTQSFIAAALDPRISVSFPAVMVSTGMEGGCTCENSCLLRLGTGNVEIAALFAPKPLGMTAANDWTRSMPQDGFPELQRLYSLYGKQDSVGLFPILHHGHNYNHVSRVAMYGWMSDHLGLGYSKPILESDFTRLSPEELSVWDDQHQQPEGGERFERSLMKLWAETVDQQMRGMLLGDRQQNEQLSQLVSSGWRVVLGLTADQTRVKEAGVLTAASEPTDSSKNAGITLQVDQKRWLYQPVEQEQTLVDTKRLAAAYTYGYNLTSLAQQSQRLALSLKQLSAEHPGKTIQISGHGPQAGLAAAAVFCLEQECRSNASEIPSMQLQLSGGDFRFANVTTIRDPYFLPGAARYWDLPGLLASLASDAQWTDAVDPVAQAGLRRLKGN